MKKTLYVSNDKNYEIMLDGPSLWVRKNNKSGFRIPFRSLDYVFFSDDISITYDIMVALSIEKIPLIFFKKSSNLAMHVIPYYDSGYFYEIIQRVASKKKEIIDKVHFFMLKNRQENEIEILKSISENIGIAFKEKNLKDDDYTYLIIKFAKGERKKLFILKRVLRSFLRQLITTKCIENNLDPKIGIVNTKDQLGMVKDILFILDAETDLLSIKFLKLKQSKLWANDNLLSNAGMKALAVLYEKRKDYITKKVSNIIEEILKIIYQGET